MGKVDIKKAVLCLGIFMICAVLTTSLLIFLKLNSLPASYVSSDTISKQEFAGTKKNQRYSQNDLKIVKENVNYKGLEYQSLRINGLINKQIENKINEELENVENDFRERVLAASGENSNMYLTSYVDANYSNILSVSFYASKSNSNYRNEINIHKFLNYDLTTGNQIQIEDIFVPNVDINLLAQDYIYKEKLYEGNEFFDSEYWKNGELNCIDELGFINEFLKYKNSEKSFYITSTGVGIRYSNDYNTGRIFIDFKSHLDKVVVYDRYVSEQSIFEFENIGLKDLYVCSDVDLYGDNSYYVIEDVAPNFRIDARVNTFFGSGAEDTAVFKSVIESVKAEISQRKEEFTKKSKENNEKYYLLDMVYTVNAFDPAWWIAPTYDATHSYDKFIVSKQERIYEMSIDDFLNWFEDKMISIYTSEIYNSDYQIHIALSDTEIQKCNYSESYKGTVYDVFTGEATENIEDILIEGIDYVTIIADYLEEYNSIPREQTEKILKNHEYHIEVDTIVFDEINMAMGFDRFKLSE